MRIIVGLLALLGIVFAAFASRTAFADDLAVAVDPSSVGLPSDRLTQIGSWYQDRVTSGDLPGTVIAVARNGKLAYLKTIGFQDHGKQIPMREDSIFWIESMMTPITCAAIMILVEDGKLDLDAPAARYLPELGDMKVGVAGSEGEGLSFVAQERPMLVRDLLRQTSGLLSNESNAAIQQLYQNAKLYRVDTTLANLVPRLAKLPLAHQPGEVWAPSGIGYDVLARLIEVASGQAFDDFLATRIFDPLRMTDTGFYIPPVKFERFVEAPPDMRPFVVGLRRRFISGNTPLASTAADYLRFAQMLLNGGELDGVRILSRQSVLALVAQAPPSAARVPETLLPAAGGMAPGLGVFFRTNDQISDFPGSVGSYGTQSAYGSYFQVDPSEKLVMVQMQMGQRYVNEVRKPMSDLVYRALLTRSGAGPSAPLRTADIGAVTQFAGKYYFGVSPAAKRSGPEAASDSFGGVGIEPRLINGFEIRRVIENSPAAQSGLRAGDVVTEVDDVSIKGLPPIEIMKRIRGPRGTQVRLKISRASEGTREMTLTRAPLFEPPLELEIRADGGKLVAEVIGRWPFLGLEIGKPVDVTSTPGGEFFLANPDHTHVVFLRDAQDAITGVILDPGPMAMRGMLLDKPEH